MKLFDRIYNLHRILSQSRYPVSRTTLQQELGGCSRATIHRYINNMRDFLQAPIEYDRNANGYYYSSEGEHPYELPGLWFNASELQALLTMQHLLSKIQPGLLESHLAPFQKRIEQILASKRLGCGQISQRIRILGMASRLVDPDKFCKIAGALLKRKQLHIVYHSRSRNRTSQRTVSPQRMAHYRDNWYLDAWDHAKRKLRSFSMDRIQQVLPLDRRAKEISEAKLNAYFASAYGIFAGQPKHTAVLRFSPERSRWVAEEVWHPKQKSYFENRHYFLEIPYSDTRELVMDILKHEPHVEVLAPAELQTKVIQHLEQARQKQKQIKLKK